MTGKVKTHMVDKGYGFIKADEDGSEYFFHISNCESNFTELKPGRRVQFESVPSAKGKRAENVVLL